MRIAFINPDPEHDYNAKTPWERGLGGSESAQVYLAIEMARRGHEVHLYTGTNSSGTYHGVACDNIKKGIPDPCSFEAIVVTNNSLSASSLRLYSQKPIVVAWEQNTWNTQPQENPLSKLNGTRDIILCVSNWQREHFILSGNLNSNSIFVLRNAPSPWFSNQKNFNFSYQCRSDIPKIVYTSVPSKGLEQTLMSFLLLQKIIPQAELHIYSDFSIYSPTNSLYRSNWVDNLAPLLKNSKIFCHGTVSQKELYQVLKNSWLLLYPCTVKETSSIVAMEAMSAGLAVVTTPIGALPETCAGFGFFPKPDHNGEVTLQGFADLSGKLCERFANKDRMLFRHLSQQTRHMQETGSWALRAREFEALLGKFSTSAI